MSWVELLDRIEGELDGTVEPGPFAPPSALGPLPAELAPRARDLQARLAAAEADALRAMGVIRQESALLALPVDGHSRFVDTLA